MQQANWNLWKSRRMTRIIRIQIWVKTGTPKWPVTGCLSVPKTFHTLPHWPIPIFDPAAPRIDAERTGHFCNAGQLTIAIHLQRFDTQLVLKLVYNTATCRCPNQCDTSLKTLKDPESIPTHWEHHIWVNGVSWYETLQTIEHIFGTKTLSPRRASPAGCFVFKASARAQQRFILCKKPFK